MKPFSHLLPETLMTVARTQGYRPTGVFYPLNSYENRVYEIHLEEHEPIVAKFYRPGRWGVEAIAEEHRFLRAVAAANVPVVGPLTLQNPLEDYGSIASISEMLYALYPKFRGRQHSDYQLEELEALGSRLGRLHRLGENFDSQHRMRLTTQSYGDDNLPFILGQTFLPPDLRDSLETALEQALDSVDEHYPGDAPMIPLHGDCHHGNILWGRDGPVLLDFDDMLLAPPVQDVWMLFNGDENEKREQRRAFFKGYEQFHAFDKDTLHFIEPLRTLRLIHYTAWVGRRYEEETFQRAFPYYRERRYWEEFLQTMKEQIALLHELDDIA